MSRVQFQTIPVQKAGAFPQAPLTHEKSGEFVQLAEVVSEAFQTGIAIAGRVKQDITLEQQTKNLDSRLTIARKRTESAAILLNRAKTQLETRQVTAETQQKLGELAAQRMTASLMEQQARTELVKSRIDGEELKKQYEDTKEKERVGLLKIFTEGTPEQVKSFLEKYKFIDPQNRKAMLDMWGRRLGAVDWHEAQARILQYFADPDNDPLGLKPTDLVDELIMEREGMLPPEAKKAYQTLLLNQATSHVNSQVQNAAAKKEAESRANAVNQHFQATMNWMLHVGTDEDYFAVVQNRFDTVEGRNVDPATRHRKQAEMVTAAVDELGKTIENTDQARDNIKQLDPKVQAQLGGVMNFLDALDKERANQWIADEKKRIRQDMSDAAAKGLGLQLRSLRSSIAALPQDRDTQHLRTMLEREINDYEVYSNLHADLERQNAGVSRAEIRSLDTWMKSETFDALNFATTIKKIEAVDPERAEMMAGSVPENSDIALSILRAPPDELQGVMAVWSNRVSHAALPAIRAERKKLDQNIFLRGANASPGGRPMARYGDLFTVEAARMLSSGESGMTVSKALKEAKAKASDKVSAEFQRLPTPGGFQPAVPHLLLGTGSIKHPTNQVRYRRLGDGLEQYAIDLKGMGATLNGTGTFDYNGKTYFPGVGNDGPRAFLEWDPVRGQITDFITDDPVLNKYDDKSAKFGEVARAFNTGADPTDLVLRGDTRWREGYGTKYVSEFDGVFFEDAPHLGLARALKHQFDEWWFDNTGERPQFFLDKSMEASDLDDLKATLEDYDRMFSGYVLGQGWLGIDPPTGDTQEGIEPVEAEDGQTIGQPSGGFSGPGGGSAVAVPPSRNVPQP